MPSCNFIAANRATPRNVILKIKNGSTSCHSLINKIK